MTHKCLVQFVSCAVTARLFTRCSAAAIDISASRILAFGVGGLSDHCQQRGLLQGGRDQRRVYQHPRRECEARAQGQ